MDVLPRRIVYVLRSINNPERHYVGLTADLDDRLIDHNEGRARHTSQYRPWRVLISLEFANHSDAAAFERYLKTGSGRAFAKRHFGSSTG